MSSKATNFKMNFINDFIFFRFQITQCNICFKRFSSSDSLQTHTVYAHPDIKPIQTQLDSIEDFPPLTDEDTLSCDDFESHFKKSKKKTKKNKKIDNIPPKVKLQNTPMSCPQCGLVVKRGTLTTHIERVHLKKLRYFCDHCGKGFYKKWHFLSHFQTHIPKELRERNIKCTMCSKTFYRREDLRKHFTSVHDNQQTEWICECGKTFDLKVNLQGHKYRVHGNGKFKMTCEQCGKSFNKSKMKEHIKVFHTKDGRKNEICTECGKRFDFLRELNRHIKKSHREHTLRCDEPGCDRIFSAPFELKQHKRLIHLKIKDFHCHYKDCGKSFSVKQRLKIHIVVTHEKQREKCPVEGCKFMVGRRDYMRNHIRKHTELNQEDIEKLIQIVKQMPNLVK